MTQLLASGNRDFVDQMMYGTYFKLARWIPARVTPNQLTGVSFFWAMASCATLVLWDRPAGFLTAALCLYLHSFFDAMDGIHARRTGQTSALGHFLDHFMDGFARLFLSVAILIRFDLFSPLFVFLLMYRILMQSIAFLAEITAGELSLSRLGPTSEVILYCLILALCFAFPSPFPFPIAFETEGVRTLLEHLQLWELNAMKCALLVYVVALPHATYHYLRQVFQSIHL